MSFAHSALGGTAGSEPMVKLRLAGQRIGSADPVAAMRHIDCSPARIGALARKVSGSHDTIEDAAKVFAAARKQAADHWQGDAHSKFQDRAGQVAKDYDEAKADSQHTATAGDDIAHGLDDLAGSVAKECERIAIDASPASDLVLSGMPDPDAAEVVNNACREVVTVVKQAVAAIPALGEPLEPLVSV